MSDQSIVALLPMKAHSARIAEKNFRMFAGKPLFKWILDTLLEVNEVGFIVINTDARAILERYGLVESDRIVIRDRKPELCGDFTSMNLILADDIRAYQAGSYLMTHTTNPLLSAVTIRRAIQEYKSAVAHGEADSLFTVNRHQTRFYREDGSPINHDPSNLIRTQDLEPWFEENSNLYIFTEKSFKKSGSRIGSEPRMFETPRAESCDIDDITGWNIAERLALAPLTVDQRDWNINFLEAL